MVATPTLPPNTGAGGSGPSGEIGGVRLGSPYKPSLSLASSPNLSRLTTPQNKNEDTLAKLMESLPMQKVAEKTPRPAIIVVGKRGVGKSTLASTIAAKLGCQIIDSESVDKNEIPGETVPDFTQKMRAEMESGNLISTQMFVESYIDKDACKFSGYVLDGIPADRSIPSRPATNQKTSSSSEAVAKPATPPTAMAIKQPTPPSSDPAATAAAASTSNSIPAGKPSSTKVYDNDYIQNPLLERLTYVAENAKMSGSRPRTGQKQQQQQTSEFIPDYRPILVHIVVPDNNLKRRRLVQKIDPDTGIIYSGAQIEASWKLVKAKPSSREGEEGMVDEDGNPIDSEEEKPAEEEQPEEEEEEEEEEDGGDGEEKTVPEINEDDYINTDDSPTEFEKKKKKLLKMAPVEEKNLKISNKTAWDIIPESVLRRLITRPEDKEENVDADLKDWKLNYAHILDDIESKAEEQKISFTRPFKVQIINIDGTQHPDVLIKDALNRIESLGAGWTNKLVQPKLLPSVENKGRHEEDVLRHYANINLETDEQPREVGPWAKYCPVSFCEDHALVITNYQHAVAYRGVFHFLSNEANVQKFLTNPEKYLSSPMQIPSLKICILGGPFSGKSTQGRLLSQIYNLKYINLEEILCEWDRDPNQKDLLKNPNYSQIVKKVLAGKAVPAKMLVSVIKNLISPKSELDDPEQGWVLDGFPRTVDQWAAMAAAELLPEYTVILKNDINDLAVRERGELYRAFSLAGNQVLHPYEPTTSPDRIEYDKAARKEAMEAQKAKKTGKKPDDSVYDCSWCPELDIFMYPFFDNLFNGFKEEFAGVVKGLEEKNCQIINTQADQLIQTVLSFVQAAIDPFLPKADGVNLKNAANSPTLMETGITKDFCPVTVKKKNILLKGSEAQVIRYNSKLYYLADEVSKLEFIAEPHNFVNGNTSGGAPPPLRLAVIGPSGSGKTSCCQAISAASGAVHLNFKQLISEAVSKLPEAEKTEAEESIKENGSAPYYLLSNILSGLFADEPYAQKGFVLENFPTNRAETEAILRNALYIDAVIALKIDAESLAKRSYYHVLKSKNISELSNPEDTSKKSSSDESERDNALDDLNEKIDKENSQVGEVSSIMETQSTIPVIEIDTNKCLRPVICDLRAKLKPLIEHRRSIFCNAYAVDKTTADQLLSFGIKRVSKFGKYCPVSISKNGYTSKSWIGQLPVVYNEHIYYLKNFECKKEFLENTFVYTVLPPPKPLINPAVCIVGRPKSGKTMLSKRVAKQFDLVYLTVPIVIQSILDAHENTQLHDDIKSSLESGQALSDKLITKAIRTVVYRGLCQAKGWILDGYPLTKHQAALLDEYGVLPQNIIQMEVENEEIEKRLEIDYAKDVQENAQRLNLIDVIKLRDAGYREYIDKIREFYDNKYENWTLAHAGHSKWAVASHVNDLLSKSINRIQNFHHLISSGKAAPIAGTSIDLVKARERISKYGGYCVVSFLDAQELVKCENTTKLMTEYHNIYYHLHSEKAMKRFLLNPEKYVYGMELPAIIPSRKSAEEVRASFPATLELMGYCPVSLLEGPPGFESILEGSSDLVVEYDGKLYSMSSVQKLEKFMRIPWKYLNQKLPKKLPPKKFACDINSLPLIGYLEQSVSSKLNEALSSVGKFKPKYPYKSLDVSASEYMALHLKSANPKSKEWVRKSFSQKLDTFRETCELISYLSQKMGNMVYIPPENREPGFDNRMSKFLNLKSK